MSIARRRILVAVRVSDQEYRGWQIAADREALRLPELLREAMRSHIRDLVRLRLLGAERREQAPLGVVGG
jgi:hypothetical protein